VTSDSWEAVELFSRAQRLFADRREIDALALFEEAVQRDPDFALAWMRMGDILMSRRQLDEASARWKKAIEVFRRRKLAPREDYNIRGMFASDTHDFQEAERVFRAYLLAYPNDYKPFFYIARPLLMLGRTPEAISMLREARARSPQSFSVAAQLAMFSLRAADFDAARAELAWLEQHGRADWATCYRGQLEFLTGDYDSALARFAALEGAKEPTLRSRATALEAAVLADRGQLDAAVARLAHGAAVDSTTGDQSARADKLLGIAALNVYLGRPRDARDACILMEQADQSTPRLAEAASLLARAGFTADATRLLARLPEQSQSRRDQADRLRVKGEIQLARHRAADAWQTFQQAAALEAPGVYCEYLARGAAAAGERGTALDLYRRMAGDPHYYWRYPDNDPPGTWGQALGTYLTLSRRWSPGEDNTRLVDLQARLTVPNGPSNDGRPPR
jgi:tetratricopeptide (TPR) repeat protein